MSETTIEWTDVSWNPLRGCSRVSAGCMNCYAERVAARFVGAGQPYEGLTRMTSQGPKWTGEIKLVPEALGVPLKWAKPKRVFVNSMSDLFHESVPFAFIASVFAVMSVTTRHTYQILTKRPERMVEFFKWVDDGRGIWPDDRISDAWPEGLAWKPKHKANEGGYDNCGPSFPYENVWLGVSVEDQKTADERIPLLLQVPAAVRWISAEPLLGPIDLSGEYLAARCGGRYPFPTLPDEHRTRMVDLIDWVVVGGESGHGARPMHPEWARSLRDQCADAKVPFFFKQWGEWHTAASLMSTGEAVFRQFDTFQQWVNKALTWVNGGICLDADGRELRNGGDFMRARDEGKFPVTIMHKVGKKTAGRLLDGYLHDQYPEAK